MTNAVIQKILDKNPWNTTSVLATYTEGGKTAAPIMADTALRLGQVLGTSAQLWLNLQNEFDMRTATIRIGKELEMISPVATRAA